MAPARLPIMHWRLLFPCCGERLPIQGRIFDLPEDAEFDRMPIPAPVRRIAGLNCLAVGYGAAFPNPFAGGGAARGVSGDAVWGYLSGNGLLTAVTLGRIAGRNAAALVSP
jgi:hypothetical protein